MRVLPRRKSDAERTGTMTLIEHLEELRYRLVVCLYAVAGGAVIGWFLYEPFKNLAQSPYCDWVNALPASQQPPAGCNLVFTGLLEAMLVKFKVVGFLGLAIAMPVLLYQLWAFIV
jgi:sec-independent protein translocase protein TatC